MNFEKIQPEGEFNSTFSELRDPETRQVFRQELRHDKEGVPTEVLVTNQKGEIVFYEKIQELKQFNISNMEDAILRSMKEDGQKKEERPTSRGGLENPLK